MPKKGKYSLKHKARRLASCENIPYSAALARLISPDAIPADGPRVEGSFGSFSENFQKLVAEACRPKLDLHKVLAQAYQPKLDFQKLVAEMYRPKLDLHKVLAQAYQPKLDFQKLVAEMYRPKLDLHKVLAQAYQR